MSRILLILLMLLSPIIWAEALQVPTLFVRAKMEKPAYPD